MIKYNKIKFVEVHFEYICNTFDRLRENGTNPRNVKKGGVAPLLQQPVWRVSAYQDLHFSDGYLYM